jgi:hypothetical protein
MNTVSMKIRTLRNRLARKVTSTGGKHFLNGIGVGFLAFNK